MPFKIDSQSSLEFDIIQNLDTGHASEIHLAQCTDNPDLTVAIKRCRRDSQNTEDWALQVGQEISALHHLNTMETPDWSFDMSLRNRLNLTANTVADRTIIQLISVFDIDGLPAIALEVAPPSITSQQLEKSTLINVMHQLAHTIQKVHESGIALTDFDPLTKIPRIRWSDKHQQIKIIDWNVTRESEDYKRRDLIFLGRIYFQLLTGYPAWAKNEPPVDGLPNRKNEYALDITGAGSDKWANIESATRTVIERLMIEESNDAITSADQLASAMDWVKQLSDLSDRIANGSTSALQEMESLLQEASNASPPQLRRIVDIGSFFTSVAPQTQIDIHQNQIQSSRQLLRSAYLDRISQAIEYIQQQDYGNAVAELDNARSRFASNRLLANATQYRYTIAQIGEEIQSKNSLDNASLKQLVDKLLMMVQGLESRLWDVTKAEPIRDEIKKEYADLASMLLIKSLFDDIEASKIYAQQIKLVHSNTRQSHIDQSWQIRESQRLTLYKQTIIPNLEKAEQQSLIKDRVTPRLEQLRKTINADQRDYDKVVQFLTELSQGSTRIDIEKYLVQSSLDRPYAILTISSALLPKDQSDLSADEVASVAIERYQNFRDEWDNIMNASIGVNDKLGNLRELVSENEDMIEIFREKLPTVTIPGETNERKTVYKDLEDLTQFVKAIDSVYDELASIGLNRIPNISKIQKKWMYVTNVQDPALKRFLSAIQSNLASHTHDKVSEKSLPPELAMLVYEMLDVPIPTEVMQIGQEIQLHKYVKETLRQSRSRLQDPEAIESVIGELERMTTRNLGELDQAIRQLLQKLDQFRDALQARTIVRQIRSLYRVIKRKVESENKDIVAFSQQIDDAVDDLINQKIKSMEHALDKAKTKEPLDDVQESLVRETQRVLDTLKHNNLLNEKRWHHVRNSQAYLLSDHARKLEQATTSFNNYDYAEARQHINRAFRLAELFDMPHDNRLPDELKTAEEMVQQLSQNFIMTRPIATVLGQDIIQLLDDEIEFWMNLHSIVKDLTLDTVTDNNVPLSFDEKSVERLITALKQAIVVAENIDNIRRAVSRLRELEQLIDIHSLNDVLDPLKQRLDELLHYNYTQVLNQKITEIEEIATRKRIISNESVIKRLQDGYMLIGLNEQLEILDTTESNRRQRQLQSNAYSALKSIQPKNRDEQQALAEFIDTLPPEEVRSREFQGVLTRLAENPSSYTYLMEQVHNFELPSFQSGNNRQLWRIILIVLILGAIAILAGLVLSGTLPIEGFTLPT